MANKRHLKKNINMVCMNLFAECMAVSLYDSDEKKRKNVENQFDTIIKLQDHYCRRISHPEPGMKAKDYYNDLIDKFTEQANEIIDIINS
ncbi:hypothetical protein SAMN05216354_2313 [Xylanibacter ruminicola]|jgi:hypothetical protein|uniref:Uncharacterized protein n=1 Tax=Xylanibacter ruminicola TaxID=839 RepID=A0A1H5WF68_XYLRU|nr:MULTISPECIES: hypothetical protein [Prevotellaceae]MCR5469837.1 hypothetical protein [Prevotella sp.]SEF98115.1 hypothetical protein SAMN05216354_2313 [Xylanibacter ruminicola]SEW17030.1 hypothetical protein SAMN04487827_1965 [Prevotella sp. khp7]